MSNQRAFFVLKLRQNIVLEGDLELAKMELEAFLREKVQDATDINSIAHNTPHLVNLHGFGALGSYVRMNGKQAFTAHGPLFLLPQLIRRVSFIQYIYCITQDSEAARSLLADCLDTSGPVFIYHVNDNSLIIQAIPHYALIELSDIVATHSDNASDTKRNLGAMLDALLDKTSERQAIKLANIALAAQTTTSHLSHDIHYYKAKFFPRMARSLLNICEQRLGEGNHSAIDNFVGSGTTLLEASILGIPSVGLDIDPLSVMITQAKLEVTGLESKFFSSEASHMIQMVEMGETRQLSLFDSFQSEMVSNGITFPSWLLKNRNMTLEIAEELGKEIGIIQSAVATSDPHLRNLFRVFMSDAITHKIRMRFLGTGVGRFSLTFGKTSLTRMFIKSIHQYIKVAATCEWLQQTIHLHFAHAQVVAADARNIPEDLGQFDILVTSPPYLPASSGRESYTQARAPSLIALGMGNHEEVDRLIDDTIGSMNGNPINIEGLTDDERNVVEWLHKDTLRAIKAEPVARYFLDMRQAFTEMYRILLPGALAVVISGKTSTFYQFSTRDALYVVNCAETLAQEAQQVGFEVQRLHDIQLFKSNMNARPRSLDDYYETLIMLRKPG